MRFMVQIAGEYARPVRELAKMLERGDVIGVATDTTYALVASVDSKEGVTKLRDMRSLPATKSLSMFLKNLSSVSRFAFMDRTAFRLMKKTTPGSYTFILRATKEVPRLLLTKQREVGVRICGVTMVETLLETLGSPIVTASAAYHDSYAETAEETAEAYPKAALVLDGGRCLSKPSTIVDLTGGSPVIVREGTGDIGPFLPYQ